MTMHKQHPQRCIHSHVCKWNKDNYQDCIDTDCASHRYIYNIPNDERDKVLDKLQEKIVELNTSGFNGVTIGWLEELMNEFK